MAISKKGLRPLCINQKNYYWKFTGKVFVTCEENNKFFLIIDFGWYDWIDYLNQEKPPDFEPNIATPGFVTSSIKYALEMGWTSTQDKMEIKYDCGIYSVQ